MRGIARLAHELGISTGTVSRALNGKPDVNENTRLRVLEAARALGYAPNQAARTLAQGKTRSVGFMIDLEPGTAAGGDNFFMGVFDGVQSVLTERSLDLLVLPCPSTEDRENYLSRFVRRGVVDGMILSGTNRHDSRIDLLKAANVPFVTLGRTADADGYSWIDLDFEGVAAVAVDRLVARGHRRIAITLPHGELNFGTIFRDAYVAALQRNGLSFDPALVFHTGLEDNDGYALVDRLRDIADPPTAVLLIFEAVAVGIYRRLAELGLSPGHDLAIVGLRDEATVRMLSPRLTCFQISLHAVGVALSNALLPQLAAPASALPSAPVQARVPFNLLEGDSDGGPPSRPARRRTRPAEPA